MRKLNQLVRLRQQVERQSGKPAAEIEAPVLSVLDDVCTALGFREKDKKRVLGRRGWQKLTNEREWGATLK